MKRWLTVAALIASPLVAHADCGWVLLAPPMRADQTFDTGAPLIDWVQEGAYDNATACSNGQIALSERLKILKLPQDTQLVALYRSRCLPASVVPIR